MEDLVGKIMEMMNNPESMEKIKGLTSMLKASESAAAPEETTTSAPPDPESEPSAMPAIPAETLQSVMKLMPLLSSMNKEDEYTRLLAALRPLLSEARRHRLDEAVKMMQMIKLLPLLKSQNIF